ncbi:hypothetical protein FOL46_004900, partial [Perkinsus olseni]
PGLEFGRQRREDEHEGPLPSVNDGEFLSASEHDSKVPAKHSVVIPCGSAVPGLPGYFYADDNTARLDLNEPTAPGPYGYPYGDNAPIRLPNHESATAHHSEDANAEGASNLGPKALHIQENSQLGGRRPRSMR